MGRSFVVSGFGPSSSAVAADVRDRMEKTEAARELALRGLMDSDIPIPGANGETYRQRAERLGLDRETLENAARFLRDSQSAHTPATAQHGAPAPMFVRGELYTGAESWTDGHGNTHIEGWTRNGPLVKRVEVVEERVSAGTRLVTRVRGGR